MMAGTGMDEHRTDHELLAAFRRGDAAAFEVLYHRHRAFVLRVAQRFTGADVTDALDVMQDAFLYLIRKAPELELRHPLPTFLYPVVKHLAADRRRRRARGPTSLDDADEPAVLPGLPDDVRGLLTGLGPLQREILGLRFADQLSLAEIATALGIPLGTVKSRLHHALQHLREKLDAD